MSPRVSDDLRVAGLEREIELTLEREPRKGSKDDNDAEVDDVSAVSAIVATNQTKERPRIAFA